MLKMSENEIYIQEYLYLKTLLYAPLIRPRRISSHSHVFLLLLQIIYFTLVNYFILSFDLAKILQYILLKIKFS